MLFRSLAKAVAMQVGAYERAQSKYQQKIQELKNFEQQARLAQRMDKDDAARLAMTRAIQIEKLLPSLEQQVQQAAAFVGSSKDKLNRERIKLEQYKSDMQNIKDLAEVNAALESIAKVNNDFDIGSARSSFDAAKNGQRLLTICKALADSKQVPPASGPDRSALGYKS